MAARVLIAAISLLAPLAHCITPEQMLSAPRRSSAVTNADGEWAVFSSSAYSFDEHSSTTEWYLMNVSSGNITKLPFEDEVSEMVWVGETNTSVLYVNANKDGGTPGGITLWTADLSDSSPNGYFSLCNTLLGSIC
jgi:dipeptidyl aminopeptidase/acylaminoacyl peptidase